MSEKAPQQPESQVIADRIKSGFITTVNKITENPPLDFDDPAIVDFNDRLFKIDTVKAAGAIPKALREEAQKNIDAALPPTLVDEAERLLKLETAGKIKDMESEHYALLRLGVNNKELENGKKNAAKEKMAELLEANVNENMETAAKVVTEQEKQEKEAEKKGNRKKRALKIGVAAAALVGVAGAGWGLNVAAKQPEDLRPSDTGGNLVVLENNARLPLDDFASAEVDAAHETVTIKDVTGVETTVMVDFSELNAVNEDSDDKLDPAELHAAYSQLAEEGAAWAIPIDERGSYDTTTE